MKSKLEKEIIIYGDDFVPQPGWKIHKTNSKIKSFDWNSIQGEYWTKCRTTEVCNFYDSGNEGQVPFNLSVLLQLMQKNLVPQDWKTYLANTLPINKYQGYETLRYPALDVYATIHNEDRLNKTKIIPYREIPFPITNKRSNEDSWESIAFVGTVYLNHNGNPCVPALYMKPNQDLAIRYICPNEILKTNGSALAHVHGFRDRDNNLPSTIAYGFINL